MRSLFWRIFANFWLAIALVAGLSIAVGHALNQDAWILSRHPALKNLPQVWSETLASQGPAAALQLLESTRRDFRIDVQVLDEGGKLLQSTFPLRAAVYEARQESPRSLPWRRITNEYRNPLNGENYLFIYRIRHPDLAAWHRGSLLWPLTALGIALVVVSLLSLLLTLSFTRPLNRLRGAVHDLGQTSYQQNSLEQLGQRRDELGVLARDFNRMGSRLQDLIGSQRQLLRDVSHELRSPLARLRFALALAERAEPEELEALWPRLVRECDRLEALISEILALARMDAVTGAASLVDVPRLLHSLQASAQLNGEDQRITLTAVADVPLIGWTDMLERAVDNLLRNALRFNPTGQPVELSACSEQDRLLIQVRDHGPGADPELLPRLGEPFFRAPGQSAPGHGLGLAIARRAAERHGGRLVLENSPQGGFQATLELPLGTNNVPV